MFHFSMFTMLFFYLIYFTGKMPSGRAPIERWNRTELEDRFHSTWDEVQALKQSNHQLKRDMKIMNGRIGAGRGGDIRDGPERDEIGELHRSNQVLSQKLKVLKHQLLSSYTAAINRPRPTAGGGIRPSSGQSKTASERTHQNRAERPKQGPGKRPQSALVGPRGGQRQQRSAIRGAPGSAGTIMMEADGVNGRGGGGGGGGGEDEEEEGEPRKGVAESGDARGREGGRRKENSNKNGWAEIVPMVEKRQFGGIVGGGGVGMEEEQFRDGRMRELQRQNRMILAENEELRIGVEKNEQRLCTLRREYDRIATELERSRKELRSQSDSLSSYREEAQRKTESTTKSAEISDRELAILREEWRALKASHDRLVARSLEEETGGKSALEELGRLRGQLEQSSSENEAERREWEGLVQRLRAENGRLERELEEEREGERKKKKNGREKEEEDGVGRKNARDGEDGRGKRRDGGGGGGGAHFEGNAMERKKIDGPTMGGSGGEAMLNKLFSDVMGIVESHIGGKGQGRDDGGEGGGGGGDNSNIGRWKGMYEDVYEELEKVRRLLLSEHKMNAGLKEQIQQMALENENLRAKYEQNLLELKKELEERGKKVGVLERELESVAASGEIRDMFMAGGGEKNGQAMIESTELSLFVSKLRLTQFGMDLVGHQNPAVFIAIEFFDFELQTSQLVNGPEADFNLTSVFELTVSDLFIHYLQTEGVNIELYIVRDGLNYQLWSQAQISLKKLLSTQTPTQFRGELRFLASSNEVDDQQQKQSSVLATMAYTLQVPFSLLRALSAQRRRMAARALFPPMAEGNVKEIMMEINELVIQIHRCGGLDQLKGAPTDSQKPPKCPPSARAYAVAYEFFHFPVHMSKVVGGSANPQFDECHSWKLPAGSEAVHKYLAKTDLLIYVMMEEGGGREEGGQKVSPSSPLASLSIPLFPLSRNQKISGTFPLADRADESIGAGASIDISLYWKFAYVFENVENVNKDERMIVKKMEPLTKNDTKPAEKRPKEKDGGKLGGEKREEKIVAWKDAKKLEEEVGKMASESSDESEPEMSEEEMRRRLFASTRLEESKGNVEKLEKEYTEMGRRTIGGMNGKKGMEEEKKEEEEEEEERKGQQFGREAKRDEKKGGGKEEGKLADYDPDLEFGPAGKEQLEGMANDGGDDGSNGATSSSITEPDKIGSPKSSEEGAEDEEEEGTSSVKSDATYTMEGGEGRDGGRDGEGGDGEGGTMVVVIGDADMMAKEGEKKEEEENGMRDGEGNEKEENGKPAKPEPAIRRSLLGELPPILPNNNNNRGRHVQQPEKPRESLTEAANRKEEPSERKTVEFSEPLHSSIPPSDISASFSEELLTSGESARSSQHSNASESESSSSANSREESATPRNDGEKTNEGGRGGGGGEEDEETPKVRRKRRVRKSKQRRQINIDAVPTSPAIRIRPREESFEESVSSGGQANGPPEMGAKAIVLIRVAKLRLLEHSPLLHPDYDSAQVYVEWNFLDIERNLCETDGAVQLPRHASEHIDFGDQQRAYQLNHRRVALLKQWTELNIRLTFTLVMEPGEGQDGEESDDLCMAELDLMEVLNGNEHTLIMRNVDNLAVAVLEVNVEYSNRLMHDIREAIDEAEDGIVEV